ncbi:hypothetical protein DER46DRAFT_536377, partial [Fusarium sp. MPI-SDFR-AT-0072]
MRTRLKSPDLYTIGWIAALPIERAAATALLDERHDVPEGFHQHRSDANSYTWGRIGEHNIAIASLPAGVYGITSTANTAANLIHSLPHIRIGLLVGIGGGIARPDLGQDIRLGDIVVSQPDGTTGGVVQYDLGKAKANGGWERKGSLDKPPPVLLHALTSLQAEHEIAPSRVSDLLQAMWEANPHMSSQKNGYTYQGVENDRLFEPHRDHVGGSTCDKCDSAWEMERDRRESTDPEIHYGIIASGNKLIKDAATRDSLSEDTGHQCLCVEMEAAGLMDRFPCLVIRGICDYADSHKNDRWQRYAAAAAAAFAVELLGFVPAGQLDTTQKVIEVMQSRFKFHYSKLYYSTFIQNVDYNIALDKLPVAEGASFDSSAEEHSPTCLPNTRVELLEDIDRWIDDPNSKIIFWLNGMAGTGKSTISRTIAQARHERGDLGASFFFKRGETDRGNIAKFVPTLVRQLISNFPGMASLIKDAIDADPEIVRKTVGKQFERLIEEPLSKLAETATQSTALVIVIDALDECERGEQDRNVQLLFKLFSRLSLLQLSFLRVFITCRPEPSARLGFKHIQGTYENLVLQNMSESVVSRDISTFLRHNLDETRTRFNDSMQEGVRLSTDWPGEAVIQSLTRMATPLFIIADTFCRFINDGSPRDQLETVLKHAGESYDSKFHITYSTVLKQQLTNEPTRDKKVIDEFRLVIGTIVTVANPLSVYALTKMLNLSIDTVAIRLNALHSVLNVPLELDIPVRLLHLSFREYLVSPESRPRNPFWVNEKLTHRNLAKHCLRLMQGALCENICGLSFPGMRRSELGGAQLEQRIPSELQYACMYWIHHQIEAAFEPNGSQEVYDFLTTHFLHWMEALSLLGRAWECLDSIRSLVDWLEASLFHSLNFLADAVRFLQANFSVINEAPLQIYSSALAFAPKRSMIRRIFEHRIPKWLSVRPQVKEDWDACLLTLEGHSHTVNSVVFSHDSKMVASASRDQTVRIWDAKTGKCEHVLEGHSNWVDSVVFSHD